MKYKYNIGEILLFVSEPGYIGAGIEPYLNTEVEILGHGHRFPSVEEETGVPFYQVRLHDGITATIREPSLRRLPPKDETISWEEVRKTTGWVPKPVSIK